MITTFRRPEICSTNTRGREKSGAEVKGEQMFKEERAEAMFNWDMIGSIAEGRPNLGPTMDLSVYRLMQFTLRDVLIQEHGVEAADRLFYKAGELAGRELFKAVITQETDFAAFIRN